MPRHKDIYTYNKIISIVQNNQPITNASIASEISASNPNTLNKVKYLVKKGSLSAQNINGKNWIFWKPPLFISSSKSDTAIVFNALASSKDPEAHNLLTRLSIKTPQTPPTKSNDLPNSVKKSLTPINSLLSTHNFITIFTVSTALSCSRETAKHKLKVLSAQNLIGGQKHSNSNWIFHRVPLFLSSLEDAKTLHNTLSNYSPESKVLLRRLQPILPTPPLFAQEVSH